jgi:hypothetical protein
VTTDAKLAVPMINWGIFMRKPVDYIDAGRLEDCFDYAFSPELCERLRGTGRLQDRLCQLISKRCALAAPIADNALEESDRNIALSPVEHLLGLIRRSGAIYWANAIANVVLAEKVRLLHDQVGEALCAFALVNRDLSGPGETFELLTNANELVTKDGERCFAAWCQSLPEAVGKRVGLKLPMTCGLVEEPAGLLATIGPSIVRRAAR